MDEHADKQIVNQIDELSEGRMSNTQTTYGRQMYNLIVLAWLIFMYI